ncbi:MAG: MoaD/ThiS family protein [bacterium]
MSIKVRIPQPLQKITNGQELVEVNAGDIKGLIADLDNKYPGIKDRICDENGKIRRFINVYVNDEDIRFGEGDGTILKSEDEVSIIPAIAGGS